MIVHFASADGWEARLIKAATLSRFSHCAIQIGGEVFEATFARGVSRTSISEFHNRYPGSVRAHIPAIHVDEKAARAWLIKQVGKGYDFGALVGLASGRNWQNPDKWFCSELVAAALVKAGALRVGVRTARVTPRDLYFSYNMRWLK